MLLAQLEFIEFKYELRLVKRVKTLELTEVYFWKLFYCIREGIKFLFFMYLRIIEKIITNTIPILASAVSINLLLY